MPGISSSVLENLDGFNADPRVVSWFQAGSELQRRLDDSAMNDIVTRLKAVRQ
jgi:hypothetical protein